MKEPAKHQPLLYLGIADWIQRSVDRILPCIAFTRTVPIQAQFLQVVIHLRAHSGNEISQVIKFYNENLTNFLILQMWIKLKFSRTQWINFITCSFLFPTLHVPP